MAAPLQQQQQQQVTLCNQYTVIKKKKNNVSFLLTTAAEHRVSHLKHSLSPESVFKTLQPLSWRVVPDNNNEAAGRPLILWLAQTDSGSHASSTF